MLFVPSPLSTFTSNYGKNRSGIRHHTPQDAPLLRQWQGGGQIHIRNTVAIPLTASYAPSHSYNYSLLQFCVPITNVSKSGRVRNRTPKYPLLLLTSGSQRPSMLMRNGPRQYTSAYHKDLLESTIHWILRRLCNMAVDDTTLSVTYQEHTRDYSLHKMLRLQERKLQFSFHTSLN